MTTPNHHYPLGVTHSTGRMFTTPGEGASALQPARRFVRRHTPGEIDLVHWSLFARLSVLTLLQQRCRTGVFFRSCGPSHHAVRS